MTASSRTDQIIDESALRLPLGGVFIFPVSSGSYLKETDLIIFRKQ
jgi:hypothetical protein